MNKEQESGRTTIRSNSSDACFQHFLFICLHRRIPLGVTSDDLNWLAREQGFASYPSGSASGSDLFYIQWLSSSTNQTLALLTHVVVYATISVRITASYYAQTTADVYHQRRRKEMMEVSGDSWRTYYSSGEHPLSSTTSAVLGVADDAQPQSLVTEYYKLPPLGQDAHLNLHKDVKIDVWPAGGALKAANGAHGAELGELSVLLHAGSVKREPEDLSRKVADEPQPHALKPPRHKHTMRRAHRSCRTSRARPRPPNGRPALPAQCASHSYRDHLAAPMGFCPFAL
ncbi:unnamed protein product, partial [Iphiclides podalirius]